MNAAACLAARDALGASVDDIASLFSVAPAVVARWEAGGIGPTGWQVALFRALAASPRRLEVCRHLHAAGVGAAVAVGIEYILPKGTS